jgi:hypothetical protein
MSSSTNNAQDEETKDENCDVSSILQRKLKDANVKRRQMLREDF